MYSKPLQCLLQKVSLREMTGRVCVAGLQLLATRLQVQYALTVVLRYCNSVPLDATTGNEFGDKPLPAGNPVNSVCS